MKINYFSDLAPYNRGAFDMFMRLKDLFEPEANAEMKAIFRLLEDPFSRAKFLKGDFEKIGFKNHFRKNKKLVSCDAYFMVWDDKNGWHEGNLSNA